MTFRELTKELMAGAGGGAVVGLVLWLWYMSWRLIIDIAFAAYYYITLLGT